MARFKKQLVKDPDGRWRVIYAEGQSFCLAKAHGDKYEVFSLCSDRQVKYDNVDAQTKKQGYYEYSSFYLFKEDGEDHVKMYNKFGHNCYLRKRTIDLNKVVIDNKARKWIHLVPIKRYAHPMDVD